MTRPDSTSRETTAYGAEQFESNHPPGIERHYWHHARNRISLRRLRPHLSKADAILDIGCGPGVVVDFLRRRGFDCEGADLGSPRFTVPGVRQHLHLGQDVFELAEPTRLRTTVLLLMDVLEHLPSPEAFLEHCCASFPSVRCLYVTLPARMEIWSNYDEYYGHLQRYTLEEMRGLRLPEKFHVRDSGYFFHSLYWAARAVRLVSRERTVAQSAPRFSIVHEAIGTILTLEEQLMPKTQRGSSLYAVALRS